jgi:phenylacetate-CoA ligase
MNNISDYFVRNREMLHDVSLKLSGGSKFYKRLLRRSASELVGGKVFDFNFFEEMPQTLKDDLKRGYPHGFLASKIENIRSYYESSGTTGGSIKSSRTSSMKTQKDIDLDMVRRIPYWVEVSNGDIAIINLPYALTSSAHSFHKALSEKGAIPVPVDQGHIFSSYSRAFDLTKSLEAKILVCSNPLLLQDVILHEEGVDIFDLPSLEYVFVVGTVFSDQLQKDLERKYKVRFASFYGLSEFGAVGVPCEEGHVHVHEGFFVSILNPKNTEENLNDPTIGGEVLITDLDCEGTPYFKYRTGDAGRLLFDQCGCEMKSPRISVLGRLKDIIQDDEKLLFPTDFQNLFIGVEAFSPIYKLIAKGDEEVSLELHIQARRSDKIEIEKGLNTLRERISVLTNLPVEINVVSFGELFAELYSQKMYKDTQRVKNMSFFDERKGQWIITY